MKIQAILSKKCIHTHYKEKPIKPRELKIIKGNGEARHLGEEFFAEPKSKYGRDFFLKKASDNGQREGMNQFHHKYLFFHELKQCCCLLSPNT